MSAIEKNLAALRGLATPEMPTLGPMLYETLNEIIKGQQNISMQVNGNPTGEPKAPPAINALTVTAQNGHFNVAIQDKNPIYRGIRYYVEHDTDPQFSNPQVHALGDARNGNLFLGNGTHHFRAYSAYIASPPSAAVYHGSANQPTPVAGGGDVGGPAFQASQSSGTGAPGQGGASGPGQNPFRSTTGIPPTR